MVKLEWKVLPQLGATKLLLSNTHDQEACYNMECTNAT
jgi:hypothetical protein